MAMTSSQIKAQQNNMAGTGSGWPRRNSQNSATATGAPTKAENKYSPPSTAINRIINLYVLHTF